MRAGTSKFHAGAMNLRGRLYVAGACAAVVLALAIPMLSATTSSTNIAAGDTLNVHCNGPALHITQTGLDASLACDANPTTTTQPPTTTQAPGMDLIVTDLVTVPAAPAAGQAVQFTATVKNQGATAATPGTGVGFTVDGTGGRWGFGPASIAAGQSVVVSSSGSGTPAWTATNGTHTVQGYVDDAQRVTETNETNNSKVITVTVGSPTTTTIAPPTTTVPPATTVPPPTTTLPPSGKFTVGTDGLLRDPNGALFKPNGANVGTTCAFDHTGTAIGSSSVAQFGWNWTAVRLNASWDAPGAFCGGHPADMTAAVQAVINEWTAKHIVVIVASHDLTMFNDQQASLNGMQAVAAANRANPYVWYNCYNEPPYGGSNYDVQQKKCIDVVRGQGATAPIVMDGQNSANDASWDGVSSPTAGGLAGHCTALKPYDPQHNILMSMHNYGGHQDATELGNWIDAVHGAGCSMVIGEFGYSYQFGGSCGAGDFATNVGAANANFAAAPGKNVGVIAWHGTMDDSCALRSDGGSFYGSAPLSDLGSKLYSVTH